ALETALSLYELRCNCRPRLLLVHSTLFSNTLDRHHGAVLCSVSNFFRILGGVFRCTLRLFFLSSRATFAKGALDALQTLLDHTCRSCPRQQTPGLVCS